MALSELVQVRDDLLAELYAFLDNCLLPIIIRIVLDEFIKSLDCIGVSVAVLEVLDDLLHFEFRVHSTLIRWRTGCIQVARRLVDLIHILDHATARPIINVLRQTLQNDLDPLLQVVVRRRMLLNHLVVVPDVISLELNDLIDERLGDPGAQIIILCLLVQRDRDQVLVYSDHELLEINLLDQLIHVLRELEQALDDQTGYLWLLSTVFVLGEQAEQDDKDVSMITVLQHSQHRGVQVLQDQFALLVGADLVKVVNQQSLQQLVDEAADFLTRYFLHYLFAGAGLVDDGDEILGESERDLFHGEAEDVDHHL